MAKPLTLTLIIPAYNEQRHLKACLRSVAAQTIKPLEVIVVDNNSTDKTVQVAEKFKFVKVIHEKRQGVVYARDKGFNQVKGGIIGRIDADSVLPQDWVETVLDFYNEPMNAASALTGGGYFYNVPARKINGWVQSQLAYRANRFITGFYIVWGSNMALPAYMWKEVKSSTCQDNSFHEDLDLAIHLNSMGYQTHYQATLKVGAYLKRVWENRDQQNEHLARWPNTLKAHGYPLWWLSISGNILLKYVVQPFAFTVDFIMRIFNKNVSH